MNTKIIPIIKTLRRHDWCFEGIRAKAVSLDFSIDSIHSAQFSATHWETITVLIWRYFRSCTDIYQ